MPTARPDASPACTDVAVDLLVHGVVTVAQVEARDVHPGVDEGAELLEGDDVLGPMVQTILARRMLQP